jgi:hypothetical protein
MVAEKSTEISVETYKKYLDSLSVEHLQVCEDATPSKPSMLQSAKLARAPGMAKSTLPGKFF